MRRYSLRTVGAFTCVVTTAWLVVFIYVAHAGMPFNPIRLPFEKLIRARLWAPEGWGFFTRDPREERMFLFSRRADGKWTNAALAPHARLRNAFGLNRYSRAQGVEVGLVVTRLRKSDWQRCRGAASECLDRNVTVKSMRNVSPRPTLCGEVGIVLQPPVPWAWSNASTPVVMPSRNVRLRLQC